MLSSQTNMVATVLTACGIETKWWQRFNMDTLVATVLTACGIETPIIFLFTFHDFIVATVLTACGIETDVVITEQCPLSPRCNSTYRLRY